MVVLKMLTEYFFSCLAVSGIEEDAIRLSV